LIRVRTKINLQIFSVEAPAWQGAKEQEYQAYFELSQRSQAGCIGAKYVKLFLREPLGSFFAPGRLCGNLSAMTLYPGFAAGG
jgi:hypothetical protein